MSIPTWLADLGLSRYEESFVENGITEDLLPVLTHEELKALGVAAMGDRMRILAAAARLVPSNPLERLVERWPSVLAIPLREYLDEKNPVLKLWFACDVVEMLLRFTVMVGVAEARREGELPEDLVRQLADRIEHPTLGKWHGMAKAVVRGLEPGKAAVPELRPFLEEVIAPLLDGPVKPPTAESSFTRLRNTLAHGGGLTKGAASRLLKTWQPQFEAAVEKGAWLGDLSLRVQDGSGSWGELRGATATSSPVGSDPALPSLQPPESASALFIVRGERCLELWPLAWHGEPLAEDLSSRGFGESPQIYIRRGEVRLEYTPVGSAGASHSVGEEGSLAAFLRLFLPEKREAREAARGLAVREFHAEIRKDADRLVGRAAEVETLRQLVQETSRGVIWVSGQAGIGKSFVVAKVVCDLLDEASGEMHVLAYRFKAGDSRCARDQFLQFCLERLAPWVGGKQELNERDERTRRQENPLDRLETLLQKIGSGRRIVFVLDGLDEIAERDPAFAREVPLALRHKGVLWLCAGRPERGLPAAFETAKALFPFPGGLPLMSEPDIREMLLEKMGPLRKKLIRGDREAGDRILNPFVERVAKCSAGLPIYVKYVVGDVLEGLISPDEGARLPPSLAKYHEELLRRCAVGDLHQVVTPLVATLTIAEEPLAQEELTALLARRGCVTGGADSFALVGRCLSAVASMIRLAPDPDGGEGYTLWHHSLRQHILESPETREMVATARRAMAEAGLRPAGDAAERYLYRQGISHLLAEKRRGEALDLMTDQGYVRGRLDALPTSQGPSGLAADWEGWLVWSRDRSELEEEAKRFGEKLGVLCDRSLSEGGAEWGHRLAGLLLWQVGPRLEKRLGGAFGFREICDSGVRLMTRLAALEPENTDFLRDLSVSYGQMASLDERADPGEARVWIGKGLEIAQRLVTMSPGAEEKQLLSRFLFNAGYLEERLEEPGAPTWFDQAIAIRRELAGDAPADADAWERLANACHMRGACAAKHGREAEAAPFDEECLSALARAEELAPGANSTPYVRACFHAVRGRADEALEALRRAVALGFTDTKAMLEDRELATLLSHPGFLALVKEMQPGREGPAGETAGN